MPFRFFGIITFLFLMIGKPIYSQMAFELLPFPDSLSVSAIAVNNEGHIFVTTCCSFTDDGIFRSIDGGQSWECLVASSGIQDFRDIKISPDGEIYVIANVAEGDSALLKSTDNGETWIKSIIPGGGPADNQKLFLTSGDTLYVSQTSNGARLLKSINGVIDWEILYPNSGYTSEMITDLAIDENGDIFISLYGFLMGTGGVYKSDNYGMTWDILGLISHQVTDLEFNDNGDLLISDRGSDTPIGGIYIIYNGSEEITLLNASAGTSGMVINSGGDIFAGDNFQNGIYHSIDGQTFEFITPVMPGDCPISKLYLDSQQYLYAIMSDMPSIARSLLSTITASEKNIFDNQFRVYFDPVQNVLDVYLNRNEQSQYIITDYSGRIIDEGNTMTGNYFQIPLPYLNTGLYIIHVYNMKFTGSAKFILP